MSDGDCLAERRAASELPPLVAPVPDDGATGNNITLIEEEWR